MTLACQRDSYLKELVTVAESCEPSKIKRQVNGKKQEVQGYEVVLADTVLFPEGGGQIDDKEVLQVTRRGAGVYHFLVEPLEVNTEVKVKVNWSRRWDHMQQHSGQHLITAIAEHLYGYSTTSWNLGEKISFIELDTANVTEDELKKIESETNEKIRQSVRVYPTFYTSADDPALAEVRTRGLPEDHVGSVRVVTIEGLEENMCCGTHVSSLSHLQAIKLLSVEKAKKGRVNVLFVAGGRVLEEVGRSYQRQAQLTAYLKGGPDQHIELLDKLQKSCKVAQKNSTVLLRDVALLEAKLYKASTPQQPLFTLHRKEGDNEFLNTIANELAGEARLMFVTTGEEKGAGLVMLGGEVKAVNQLAPKLAEMLEAKGAVKHGRYQGKAGKLQRRGEVVTMLQSYLSEEQ